MTITSILACIAFSLTAAIIAGCAAGRASAKHRTTDEDRLDYEENANVNAAKLRDYAAGGWQDRHREAAEEFEAFRLQNILGREGGFDDIDRLYLDSEGMASDA